MKIICSIILFAILTSCGNIEESNLISNANDNSKYSITVRKQYFNRKDSVWRESISKRTYDLNNRIINIDNNTFYFYDSNGKLSNAKLIYKREGKGRAQIIEQKYIYNPNGNLIAVIRENGADVDTTIEYRYNKQNQVIFQGNNYNHSTYKYKNDQLIEKVEFRENDTAKVSIYRYDKSGRKEIVDWCLSKNHKMRTYYTYYANGKIFSERDSSLNSKTNPKEYVEFKTEYYYHSHMDSISEIKNLGRILSESKFKLRGRETFQYLLE